MEIQQNDKNVTKFAIRNNLYDQVKFWVKVVSIRYNFAKFNLELFFQGQEQLKGVLYLRVAPSGGKVKVRPISMSGLS